MKIRTYLPLYYPQTRPSGAALARYEGLRGTDRSGFKKNTLEPRQLLRSVCLFLRM